jgi:hypothetical protein
MDALILSLAGVCLAFALFTLAWLWFSDEQ